jgi:NAD(P)-dependent dehydrogenase (short-subunit alcohol dehydrogenase family)
VELGAAGATVYCTGRSTRSQGSAVAGAGGTIRHDRPETIEDTADLVTQSSNGTGITVPTDHLVPEQAARLVERIDADHGRLDVVVHDIFGGDYLAKWDTLVWEHDLDDGLLLLRLAIDTHLVTARYAFPLLIRRPGGLVVEVTDGTAAYNAENYRLNVYHDLAKIASIRLARSWAHELSPHGCTAVAVTPGWLRSETMLDEYGVTEDTWRDACADQPHFAISESPRLIGRGIAALAADPDRARWQGASTSSGDLAREYGLTDLDGSAPDAWRYVVEVQDAGKPADLTGYR